jgi:hypothetical protein
MEEEEEEEEEGAAVLPDGPPSTTTIPARQLHRMSSPRAFGEWRREVENGTRSED